MLIIPLRACGSNSLSLFSFNFQRFPLNFISYCKAISIQFRVFPIGKIQTIRGKKGGRKEVNYLQTTRHSITLA